MIYVEVEAHPDRIGRHKVVDVTRLVQRYLRVARARRKRPQHDRGTAALTADQFSDGVNFLGGKRDDRGSRRKSRQLFFAGIGER